MNKAQLLADGLGFPESTRWHQGRIWFCNWGAGEVLALGPNGERELVAQVASGTLPFSIDWLPDGRLLVIDGPLRQLLVLGRGGELEPFADLSSLSQAPFNEIVVSAGGHVYVNGGDGTIVGLEPGLVAREVADGLQWPNGMALLDADRTRVVADSHTQQLIAYEVQQGGALAHRRVWAELDHAPDGICADADGAIWVATVPGKRCLRVAEGGAVLDTVEVDRGCFACTLGGVDGRTLFVAAARWRGMQSAMTEGPGSSGQLLSVGGMPSARAGRP